MTTCKVRRSFTGHERISYVCEYCRHFLESPIEEAGTTQSCPNCARRFVVPGVAERQMVEQERAQRAQEKAQRARELERRAEQRAREKAEERERAPEKARIEAVLSKPSIGEMLTCP